MRAPNRTIPPLTKQDILRFWSKIRIRGLEECWPWQGHTNPEGYAQFRLGSPSQYLKAHRIAWTIANGPIPAGLLICHHCDVPSCQNPRHLFRGTDADNSADMMQKGRNNQPRGERNNKAKLTKDQVRAIRRRYAIGSVTQQVLGREYGISHVQIGHIVNRKHWMHVI